MSAPLYSGYPWITGQTTGVPVTPVFQGPKGDTGAAGADGTDGTNAFTLTTGAFTQPAVGASVTVSVGSSSWIGTGQPLYVTGGGFYTAVSKPNATSVILTNLGYAGNAAPGATVASGALVAPSGPKGSDGVSGTGVYYGTTAELAAAVLDGPAIWILSDSDPPNQLQIIPEAA